MYKVEIVIVQRDQFVEVDAGMYEMDVDGEWSSLGDIPGRVFRAPSQGHDWLLDCLDACRSYVEMSLF
jgi:hypothetical protein